MRIDYLDVELWNLIFLLKHVDTFVGYRLESIRQTEGEIDVIVQSNLEMDKDSSSIVPLFFIFLPSLISTYS